MKEQKKKWIKIKELGKGSSGRVFLVHEADNPEGEVRVLKEPLNSSFHRQIQYEASILAQLDHPNIIKLIDCDISYSNPYLVMEYCTGKFNNSQLSPKEVNQAFMKIFNALVYIHSKGITHGDVSMRHIVFRSKIEPVLIDFGTAKPNDFSKQADEIWRFFQHVQRQQRIQRSPTWN